MKSILLRTLAVSLLFCTSLAHANDVATLVSKYEKLTLGPASPVQNVTLSSGRMKMTLASGSASQVKAGDEVVGLYFRGDGKFEYKADEPVELPVVRANLKNLKSNAKVTGGDSGATVTGAFGEVLWAAPGATLPALSGEAPSIEQSFAQQRADYALNRESKLSHLLTLQKLNNPAARPVRAEFRGAGEEWIYVYDDFETKNEALIMHVQFPTMDRERAKDRWEAPLSIIPLGRSRRDLPYVPVLLTNLDYDITAATERDVKMTIRETVVPRTNARAIAFGLWDRISVDDKAQRTLRVKKLTAADGTPLSFDHDRSTILITLPAGSAANKPVDLLFEIEGDVIHRPGGDNYWLLRGSWYPQPGLAAEVATVHGTVRVKAPFVPFTGGTTIRRATEGEYNVVESKTEQPIGFVCIAAGKYFSHEEKRERLTIRTSSYGMKNVAAAKKITKLAFDMIDYYEYFLGPFPFPELNIVEVNSFGWGQAPAGLVFITSEAFQPLLGADSQFFSEGINERLAHEIAHQYWGWGVKMPGLDEQWLTESFAEYSAALLLKKFQGEGVYNRLVNHWRSKAGQAVGAAPIPLAWRIIKTGDWDWERVYLLYNKGPVLLTALHKQLGDEKFLTFLKSYQKTFRGKFGTTKDVEGLLTFMTKQDFKPFFDQYYWGVGTMPETK